MTARSSRHPRTRRLRRWAAPAGALTLACGILAGCSGDDSGKPELVWYTNPDSGGQAKVAENCSTDDYTITTQVLPQDSGQQRIQLARRLAAGDPAIDLMSLDPPFTAEFANADFLAEIPEDVQARLTEQSFDGATAAATERGGAPLPPHAASPSPKAKAPALLQRPFMSFTPVAFRENLVPPRRRPARAAAARW